MLYPAIEACTLSREQANNPNHHNNLILLIALIALVALITLIALIALITLIGSEACSLPGEQAHSPAAGRIVRSNIAHNLISLTTLITLITLITPNHPNHLLQDVTYQLTKHILIACGICYNSNTTPTIYVTTM